ncbi:ArgS-related anticodon-binding protein NrtL [Streptomyces sp. NPDC048191]|uniref:ArgS-related anticodon-binding protein NrtL n=1 Tax=Streptomyces sp. NPDC048191 TaxID=3155484 RepID=UPI0033DB122D
MTPVELSRTVLHAVRCAVDDGELSVAVPERVVVTEPGPGGCGDFATNVALQLARPAGLPPRRVAGILRSRLVGADGIRDVVVTGPGFLNISLEPQADPVTGLVREIRARGAAYGHGDALAGQVVALRVPYEVRAEVVADAVVRIVATQGGRATVEHAEPVNLRPVPAPEDPSPLGADASQWALLHPAPHDRPRITADHLVQRESNPLFRVRYAHARIRALGRNAARLGFTAEPGPVGTGPLDADPAGTGPQDVGSTVAGTPDSRPAETGPHEAGSIGVGTPDIHPAEPDPLGAGAHSPLAETGPLGVGPTSADTPHSRPADTNAPGTGPRDAHPAKATPFHATPVDTSPVAARPADEAPPARAAGKAAPHPARAIDTSPVAARPADKTHPAHPTDKAAPHPARPTDKAAPHPARPARDLLTPLADHPRILAAAATHRAPDRLARHLVTVADAVLPFLPSVLPCGEEKPSAAHRARLALAEAAGTVLAGGLSLLGIDAPEHL